MGWMGIQKEQKGLTGFNLSGRPRSRREDLLFRAAALLGLHCFDAGMPRQAQDSPAQPTQFSRPPANAKRPPVSSGWEPSPAFPPSFPLNPSRLAFTIQSALPRMRKQGSRTLHQQHQLSNEIFWIKYLGWTPDRVPHTNWPVPPVWFSSPAATLKKCLTSGR